MVHPVSGLAKVASSGRGRALLKRRVRKGVPRAWRAAAWPLLLDVDFGSGSGSGPGGAASEGADAFREEARSRGVSYAGLVASSCREPVDPESIYEIIERDLTRTYPRHPMFETALVDGGRSDVSRENGGVSMLRRLLCAYAALDDACGYCQGMNYVCALLLLHVCGGGASANDPSRSLSLRKLGASSSSSSSSSSKSQGGAPNLVGSAEEDCFWVLVALMRGRRTRLRGLYMPGMVGAQRCLSVYGAALKRFAPSVAAHMLKEGLEPNMYATHWFVTVFCAQFPFALVSRVWDMFLAEGWKPVYRVAVALLATNEKVLLTLDFEGLMIWLRELPETVDVAAVLKAANRLRLNTAALRALEAKYDEDDAAQQDARREG